jgi:hypothetical protein
MIYRCPFNSDWIRECYGSRALESVQMNPVSCSGTTMGSRDGILIYVRFMNMSVITNLRRMVGQSHSGPTQLSI